MDTANRIWSVSKYTQGCYIQKKLNDLYLPLVELEPNYNVLDVGCGNGIYTSKLAHLLPQGRILGIDSSESMIRFAKSHWESQQISFEVEDIENLKCDMTFDCIVSFWCLHWTHVITALNNIFHVLKPGKKVYALFSSTAPNPLSKAIDSLRRSKRFPALSKITERQKKNYRSLYYLEKNIKVLPFKNIDLIKKQVFVPVPSLDIYRAFVMGMPLFEHLSQDVFNVVVDEIVNYFFNYCHDHFNGELTYTTSPYFLVATK